MIPPPSTLAERGLEIADDLVLERIPAVCTFDEANAILRISRTSANRMRRAGTYPIPQLDWSPDERPRFAGEDLLAFIRSRRAFGRAARTRRSK